MATHPIRHHQERPLETLPEQAARLKYAYRVLIRRAAATLMRAKSNVNLHRYVSFRCFNIDLGSVPNRLPTLTKIVRLVG